MTTAVAHPNIALVKYWGKQTTAGNLPATPSLSITLDTIATETQVADSEEDQFFLNNEERHDPKVTNFLGALRQQFEIRALRIESSNNFPTGAGLAASASGFAALVTAINTGYGLGLSTEQMSGWARQGSASAARSMVGGFASLTGPDWTAQSIAPSDHWPLATVIAITSRAPKAVGSGEGMERSRMTSPYYDTWVSGSTAEYGNAHDAINKRDFEQLATVAELSCLKMHSLMLTSVPTLSYWNPTTVAVMDAVRQLRSTGTGVFFTIDAGPQVKAVCLPDDADKVANAIQSVPGVEETIQCALGQGAHIVDT